MIHNFLLFHVLWFFQIIVVFNEDKIWKHISSLTYDEIFYVLMIWKNKKLKKLWV